MCVDAGADAVAGDPIAFARLQWDTWSPPGWFDDDEFAATAGSSSTESATFPTARRRTRSRRLYRHLESSGLD